MMIFAYLYCRGDSMCCDKKDNNCVCSVLNTINDIQRNSCSKDFLDTCDRGFLGQVCCTNFNTRPVILYLCDGERFSAFYRNDTVASETVIFRVESIKNCCAKLRCLKLVSSDPQVAPIFENIYNPAVSIESTNNFVILDANCCCAIQCLSDMCLKLC